MSAQNVLPSDDDADLERRFRAAGVIVPADRAVGTYAAGRRLLSVLHWIRQSRGAEVEPAHIFHVQAREPK